MDAQWYEMASIIRYSVDFYLSHMPLILLFSVSFVIAFLIPLFASLPAYNDAGAIFIRQASVFHNLTLFSTAVIIFSTLFSLLFLSFAIVAINVIVKHSRTHTKIKREVLEGLERYTSSVFSVLVFFTLLMGVVSVFDYAVGVPAAVTAIVGLILTPFFFYAPASIVIDERSIERSMAASAAFFVREIKYPLLWVVAAIALITVFDFIFIAIGGTSGSRFLLLIFNSLFIIPFLVVLQSQAYMRRFPMLKL